MFEYNTLPLERGGELPITGSSTPTGGCEWHCCGDNVSGGCHALTTLRRCRLVSATGEGLYRHYFVVCANILRSLRHRALRVNHPAGEPGTVISRHGSALARKLVSASRGARQPLRRLRASDQMGQAFQAILIAQPASPWIAPSTDIAHGDRRPADVRRSSATTPA